ncbi:MAG: endonuclease [Porphyromonadaceae bacterium CG2_30_38_12]|nr:MAG: endonuclease [Porphyromonadaceae bacterium CG2_30_38_12]
MRRLFIFTLAFLSITCKAADKNQSHNTNKSQLSCIAFYNLENLFDTIDGPNNDAEYLPKGANKWNSMKYNAKLKNMSYAISQIGLDKTPVGVALIGVSEIENRGVLEDLVKQPALANRTYQLVHYDSPDRRGVDVGLLYNPRLFTVSNTKSYRLVTADTTFRTRDQLMVSGYLMGEKIHVIVNHWPSRYGGEERSRPKRMEAAALTRSIVDSLFKVDAKAKIVVMGDLNDDPTNPSCANVLAAKKNSQEVHAGELYNVFWKTLEKGIGSLAYNDRWNLFDQIILSHAWISDDKSKLRLWKPEVFYRNFLIQQEGKYKGTPLRTTSGGVWLNGYSDHLPTLIYVVKKAK